MMTYRPHHLIITTVLISFLTVVSFALDNERITLIDDLNNIEAVEIDSSRINFLSKHGAIIYNEDDNTWEFDFQCRYEGTLIPYESYFKHRLDNQSYPASAVRATYIDVYRRVANDSTEMLLLNLAGEGAVTGAHCLIDTLSHTTYYFPFNRTKALEFNKDDIWLGHYRGFYKIQRATGKRNDFVVIPIFKEDSKVLADRNKLWIAIDGIGVEMIDIRADTVAFWSIADIFGEYPKKLVRTNFREEVERSRENAIFTNLQQDLKNIYVGCHFVDSHDWVEKESSFLLIYSKEDHTWKLKNLDGINGIFIIKLDENRLWIGANHIDGWEGGGMRVYGGMLLYNLEEDSTHSIPPIGNLHMVTNIEVSEESTQVETYYIEGFEGLINKHTIFEINKETLEAGIISNVEANYQKDRNAYMSIEKDYYLATRESKLQAGRSVLPDKFAKLLFVPKVVEIDLGPPFLQIKKY